MIMLRDALTNNQIYKVSLIETTYSTIIINMYLRQIPLNIMPK